jgi:hypothetical protein
MEEKPKGEEEGGELGEEEKEYYQTFPKPT